jgi:type IV pilus assembly protein PilM
VIGGIDIKNIVKVGQKFQKRLGLDIGSFAAKAIEISPGASDKPVISGFAIRNISNLSKQEVAGSVKEMLLRSKIVVNEAAISVSGPAVIERFISLPKMDEESLKSAIKFEAEKFIPFDINECVLDHKVLGKDERENKINVLLVAVKRDHLMSRIKITEEAGLEARVVDVDILAASNAFLRCFKNPPEKTMAVLNIGASFTNVSILRGESIFFARDLAIGGNDFNAAISRLLGIDEKSAEELKANPNDRVQDVAGCVKPVLNSLFDEVKLSFSYYENQTGKGIDEIYVSGGSSNITGLAEAFSENFGSKPSAWNPMHFADISLQGPDKDVLEKSGNSFAVAMGLALR